MWRRPACQTLSKVLDISSAIARVAPDLLKALAILSDTWYQVTLRHSNIFGISLNVSEQSFSNQVPKVSGFFGWGSYDLKLLKMTQNYHKSPLKVSELKVWVKPVDVFENVKTVPATRKPIISISSDDFLFHALNVSLCY